MDMIMVLGLDIGTNSIGWALMKYTADGDKLLKPANLVDAGVRVFPQGVDDKTQESRNLKRREARSARRVHHRRNQRVYDLKSALQEKGLLPSGKDDMEILMRKNPYALRAAGLDHKIEPFEFGRAVYHLGHRRGFKSNRKDAA
ncbi:MAG: type II CRISPR RNA-guided endonuclease Cas9, partial [Deltaproteobacteria bacterium]|nr:type II CRISPR RNA-guided endonuclease Cas9 [Deltaproteobacteria bacterium]